MNEQQLQKLAEKYGKWSSWAIWNEDNLKDTSIISECAKEFHAEVVIVGLNISKPLQHDWSNFHAGKHDGKLSAAFNKHKRVRGAYMTDLLKKIEVDSKNISKYLLNPANLLNINIQKEFFQKELQGIGVTEKTLFILVGRLVEKHFPAFTDNKYQSTVYLRHYSDYRLTKEQWINEARKTINI